MIVMIVSPIARWMNESSRNRQRSILPWGGFGFYDPLWKLNSYLKAYRINTILVDNCCLLCSKIEGGRGSNEWMPAGGRIYEDEGVIIAVWKVWLARFPGLALDGNRTFLKKGTETDRKMIFRDDVIMDGKPAAITHRYEKRKKMYVLCINWIIAKTEAFGLFRASIKTFIL